MNLANDELNALVDAAIQSGETVETYGEYDDELDEGHCAELIQHGEIFLVGECVDGEEKHMLCTDEARARQMFEDVKAEIERELE